MTGGLNQRYGQALSSYVAHATSVRQVHKSDLKAGDHLYIVTENSRYHVRSADAGWYVVSGGWFDHKGIGPLRIKIAGCTWGGSVIKVDVVAAVGLSVEFGNRVTTSPIQKIILIPRERQN